MKRPRQFEPGDAIAWYMGPTTFRGHVEKVLRGGDELIVISTTGVRWNLMPSLQQVDLLPPLDIDWMRAIR